MKTVDPQLYALKDVEVGTRLPAGTGTTVLAFDHNTYQLGYRTDPDYAQPDNHTAVATFIRLGLTEGLFLLKAGGRNQTIDIGTMGVIARGVLGAVDGNSFAGLINYQARSGLYAYHYKNGDVFQEGLVTDYGRVVGRGFPLTIIKRTLTGFQIMEGREWVGVLMNERTELAISGKQFISRVDMSDSNWAHCLVLTNEKGEACIIKITRLGSGEYIGTVEVSGIMFPGMYIGSVAGQPILAAYAMTRVEKRAAITSLRVDPANNVRGFIAHTILRGRAEYYRLDDNFQAHPVFAVMAA